MDMTQRRAFGPVIRAAREQAKLTQDELAEQAGTTRRTIGSIERGDSTAQRQVLDRVLKVLDLAPEQVDGDVTAFLAMLSPLLQRVSPEERQRLMPDIVRLVVKSMNAPRVTEGEAVEIRSLSAPQRPGRTKPPGPDSGQ